MGARLFEIVWDDGVTTFYRHVVLRGFCPCALCQGHDGPVRWVDATDTLPDAGLELRDIIPTGSYALRLDWADGHNTGIYTFEYLRQLAALHDAPADLRERHFGR